jgi:quercetin dioxygenase-like cupin family protein
VVELWDWTLEAGEIHASEAHAPGTRELVHVLRGVLNIEAAGQSVTLRSGDAVAFPGDTEHRYANDGKRPARFSLAVFEPGVRARRKT